MFKDCIPAHIIACAACQINRTEDLREFDLRMRSAHARTIAKGKAMVKA